MLSLITLLTRVLADITPEDADTTFKMLDNTLREGISDAIKKGELMNAEGVPVFKSEGKKSST